MILADTSIWVDHLRTIDRHLASLLDEELILVHPMVIGELACGNIPSRPYVMRLLNRLPCISVATHDEVLLFVERHRFMGRGIGYIDAHLLASVVIMPPARLWTNDRRLMSVADELGVAYDYS